MNGFKQFIYLTAASLVAGSVMIQQPSVTADDTPDTIVAHDDHFRLWAGSGMAYMPVEQNDEFSNPQSRVPIAGLKKLTEGKDGVTLANGGIRLDMPSDRKTDIKFQYRYEDPDAGVYSNWATVTIDVRPTKQVKTSQPRPHRLKLRNPNSGTTECWWGTPTGAADGPDGHARIKAHSAKTVKIHRKVLYLSCSIGKYGASTAERILRHLR